MSVLKSEPNLSTCETLSHGVKSASSDTTRKELSSLFQSPYESYADDARLIGAYRTPGSEVFFDKYQGKPSWELHQGD